MTCRKKPDLALIAVTFNGKLSAQVAQSHLVFQKFEGETVHYD